MDPERRRAGGGRDDGDRGGDRDAAQPNAALGEVRLLPWNSIMLVAMIAAVFAAVHLLTLWRGG